MRYVGGGGEDRKEKKKRQRVRGMTICIEYCIDDSGQAKQSEITCLPYVCVCVCVQYVADESDSDTGTLLRGEE